MRPRALLRSLSSPDTMRHRRRFQAADSSQLHLEGRGRISKIILSFFAEQKRGSGSAFCKLYHENTLLLVKMFIEFFR